jgi:type III pantothenate kinase
LNLIIDIGNSLAKLALFQNREIQHVVRCSIGDIQPEVERYLSAFNVSNVAISNVGNKTALQFIHSYNINVLDISVNLDLPIDINYKTPNTLGIDRICGAVGSHAQYPNNPVLSIDIGTCITYDLVVNHTYLGGGISPGYASRLNAMHDYTERLPRLEPTPISSRFGTNTNDSMYFGAGYGTLCEINGMIKHFRSIYHDLKVILTGGEHSFFEQHVENPIFAAPNLVLEGINEILLHQIEKRA